MRREGKNTASSNAKHLITIQYAVKTSDGEGGFTTSWTSRPNVWAEICPISASQNFDYKSVNVDATHRIKIRGNLSLQSNTKFVNQIWAITWSGISGTNIKLHYQIDGGNWVQISASETNDGSYSWSIPVGAIGKNVVVRVMHSTDSTIYVLTDPYNVVAAGTVSGLPSEHDQIVWTVNGVSRTFEVLFGENMQERNIEYIITCKERR